MRTESEIRTLFSAKTGAKYMCVSDLIAFLDKEKEFQPEEVQKFIGNLIVSLVTAEDRPTGESYSQIT